MKREYVIVCNRHAGVDGSLLFWGHKTEASGKRSFGGYTSNFNNCEKYTIEELQNSGYNFPVYGEQLNRSNWKKADDFIIKISSLKDLGYRPMLIYYR
ncbi:hypothetical protein NL50_17975 [Clostridium acetobutylicum]|nr:hypothetical protein NL50_17975 [Clostridium acetobutylicum]